MLLLINNFLKPPLKKKKILNVAWIFIYNEITHYDNIIFFLLIQIFDARTYFMYRWTNETRDDFLFLRFCDYNVNTIKTHQMPVYYGRQPYIILHCVICSACFKISHHTV